MPFIIPANTLASGGYEVANSLRFGVNTYMHKVLGSDNEKDTWTFSLWVKRGKIGSVQRMMTHNGSTSGKFFYLRWEANEQLHFHIGMSDGNFAGFDTTQVFRDRSAWYHIVCAVDTTQATESNRVKIYVNGSQVTAFGTANYPARNVTALLGNTATPMVVGTLYGSGFGISSGSPQEFYDGYLAEVCFIDDLQLAADSFGEFDEDSGIWKAIDVSGLTFGTDGFYLDFKASGNLGNDANGGTDLTEVNLAATDQSIDTCTNNFATLNGLATGLDATLSEGNLKMVSGTATTRSGTASSIGLTAGKWFAEFKITGSANGIVGIAGTTQNRTATDDDDIGNYPGRTQQGYGYLSGGDVYNNSSAVSGSFASFTTNDFIGVALDLDNNLLYFYKNGAIQNSGTGIDISGITPHSGNWFFAVGDGSGSTASTVECNFGNPITALSSAVADGNGFGAFEFTPKSGHLALCTKNLAENG